MKRIAPCKMDRITNLPPHVIDEILSRLPILDAVRTSFLSREWRYKWRSIPDLVFDDQCVSLSSPRNKTYNFINIVYHVLFLHHGPIRKFKLDLGVGVGVGVGVRYVCVIDRWILHASRKSIREFVLHISEGQRYQVHTILFSCESLIHLDLYNCLLKPPSTFKGFKNLTSLALERITLGQDVFVSLIRSCSVLESLTLKYFDGLSHLYIDAPNLRVVDIKGTFDDVNFMNTDHLSDVCIDLVEKHPTLARESPNELFWFFAPLPNIQWLEIRRSFLKYLANGNVPNKLPRPCVSLVYLSLDININNLDEGLAALCLLRSSPNIQELEILSCLEKTGNDMGTGTLVDFWDICDHYNSMFAELQVVSMKYISGSKSELALIKFLLSNSPVLKRMTVHTDKNVNHELELTKELMRFRRASATAEIIYLGS